MPEQEGGETTVGGQPSSRLQTVYSELFEVRDDGPVYKPWGHSAASMLAGQCPTCRITSRWVSTQNDWSIGNAKFGVRFCPNPSCGSPIFFVLDDFSHQLLETWPPRQVAVRIPTSVPLAVRAPVEEAQRCYQAGCYQATAMMVRKAIENLCNENGAKQGSLSQRIDQLGSLMMLRPELLDALHEIRYLGNDAAHVTAHSFDQIGARESGLGLQIAVYLLEFVYRGVELTAELRALRGSNSAT